MNKKTPAQRFIHPLKKHPFITATLVVMVIAAAAFIGTRPDKNGPSTAYYEVKRGNLLISIVEGGNVEAVSETSVRNMVEGTARIIRIVPEGTFVKKGDLLVELDSSSAQDQVNQQQITVRRAELELTNAVKQLEIAASQTNSDYTAARIQLELAKIDLTKFEEGELAQSNRELELEVDTIKEQLTIDEERYRYSTNLLAAGFETKAKADADRLTWLRTEKSLQQATNALWMFVQFDRRKLRTQYESKVEEAEEEINRVVKQSEAKMVQYQADLETKKRTLGLNEIKLERDQQNLAGTKIKAPTDGLVVYGTPEGRFSSESMIEEGATVRHRQEIIKLPDLSAMKLIVKVHEAHIGKVKTGQPAYVKLDFLPDERFMGRVSKVAVLASSQDRWSNPNLTVYNTEIMITDKLPDTVKPKISASAEIVITNLNDVLTVPVQAVTTLGGKPVVYLAGASPKPRLVDVGMFNSRFIEITHGLEEGDRVLLSPPFDNKGSDIDGTILKEGEGGATNEVTVAQADGTHPPGAGSFGQVRRSTGEGAESPAAPENIDNARRTEGGPTENGAGRAGFNREEFAKRREEMMKQYDKDGDGQLSESERTAMGAAFGRNRNRSGQGGEENPRPPRAAADDGTR